MAIYGIDGQFGSGKTSFLVYLANKMQGPKTAIFSNIVMDSKRIQNYYYFDDDKFLETIRTVNTLNDIERMLYTHKRENSDILFYDRKKFTKCLLLFDEAGAIMNNREYKNFDNVAVEYINQNRKMMLDIFIATADGAQTEKNLRRFVEWWFYSKPLANFWEFKNIKIVRRQKRDNEGNIATEKFLAKDERGDYIQKVRPIDTFERFYYQPFVWALYEDLHKNIRDKDKYEINKDFFFRYFSENQDFLEEIKKRPELETKIKKTLISNKILEDGFNNEND